MSVLTSGKIDKHECLTGEEILPSDENRIIEQAKFTYSPLGKKFEKQMKTIEDQGIKKVEALKALKPEENQELETTKRLFPEKIKNNEIKNEMDEIKKREEKIKQKDLLYKKNNYKYDFQQYETIRFFGDIYTDKINRDEAEMDQSNLLKNIVGFYDKSTISDKNYGKNCY